VRHTDVTNVQLRRETSSELVTEIANGAGNVGEFELFLSDSSGCEALWATVAQTLHLIYILMINTLLLSSSVVAVAVVVATTAVAVVVVIAVL